ncbi:hypothetical protein [Piscinibacter koreensis]|uniref:Uncharacterized protein n=1 Tax=Piscinibacter koreensis TaxID=2742824 RepID=A0A7Y6NQY8_9BURK|nr:hypothetical protein [Schlegelella koreensis]NUZ07597.1 hypothetical protein [Schlegelella koreensis]
MTHSIPSPPDGNVDVLSAAGAFLIRLPLERATGYVRRHPGVRIGDAPPPRQESRRDAIGGAATPIHVEGRSKPSGAFALAA